MSTIKYLTEATYLPAARQLADTEALTVFWANPEAVRALVYGGRTVEGASPAHDHEQDGGEQLLLPIVSHSFAGYTPVLGNASVTGLPLGPPLTGSFASVTTNGITDRTAAKRVYCVGTVIPGGVKGLRCSVIEYHEGADLSQTFTVCVRSLDSVNYKLGVTNQVSADITYTTVGAEVDSYHAAEITDLSALGDPDYDREVEVSLWITSDPSYSNTQLVEHFEVLPLYLATSARSAEPRELAYPSLAVRELKAGLGSYSAQMAAKIREVYNGLNRGAWGSTPGLSSDLSVDRRRRYRESVTVGHTHQGVLVPTSDGGLTSDGACLRDTQSFGFVFTIGEDSFLPPYHIPPYLDDQPHRGQQISVSTNLSAGWVRFNFRRSIPSGLGALVLRVGVAVSTTSQDANDPSRKLLASVQVVPVAGGSSIVSQILCGPFTSPILSTDTDYGYCEIQPKDDDGFISNAALLQAGKKGWNFSAEIPSAERTAAQMNAQLYRVSEEIRVNLTYPPERSSEAMHETGDYDVKIRFKLRDSANSIDTKATMLWIMCSSAPGY